MPFSRFSLFDNEGSLLTIVKEWFSLTIVNETTSFIKTIIFKKRTFLKKGSFFKTIVFFLTKRSFLKKEKVNIPSFISY